MAYLFAFFTALVVSMAIIPLMMRLAPHVGMLDQPDARKVHTAPIPRAGGAGIVLGALIPVFMWIDLDDSVIGYLFGSLVLLVFGLWDDARSLGHRIKFVGQIVAAAAVVYYGDIYISTLPFSDLTPLPVYFAKPFTVFAIVGMINALNVSDGLDGLAGGLFVLSVSSIAYLASQADGNTAIVIAVATLGGVLGFLRYNTHPARVFMGDGGSQFLGLTLAFLTLFLTQKVNSALSPALPLLFLGLPIVDLLAAITQRIYNGISPFVATKHHFHHRLLELGFDHYEAVVIIYSVQTLLVVAAISFSYESDWLVVFAYLGACSFLLALLFFAVSKGWRAHRSHAAPGLSRLVSAMKGHRLFMSVPVEFVKAAIPVLFVVVSMWAKEVPRDFGIASTILAVILVLHLVSREGKDSIVLHAVNYITAAFVVYLETGIGARVPVFETLESIYFIILAIAIGFIIKYSKEKQFKTTPMDYLVILVVFFAGILLHRMPDKAVIGFIAVKLIIVFYACELILTHMKNTWSTLNLATLGTLIIFSGRALI